MVYMSMILAKANEVFAPTQDFNPDDLLEVLSDAENVAQAAQLLGMETVVTEQLQAALIAFLRDDLPEAIDAAIMAAIRNALGRGVRVTVTWQPAYAFELRVWEVTQELENHTWVGMVNVHISSPDPEMDSMASRSP